MKLLRYVRITAAAVTALLFIAAFIYLPLAVLSSFQAVPLLLRFTLAALTIFALPAVLTVLFGRIYCSCFCPLGVIQDFFRFIALRKAGGKGKNHALLRYSLLALAIGVFAGGLGQLAGIFEPFSLWGRINSYLFRPALFSLHNVLSQWFPEKIFYYQWSFEAAAAVIVTASLLLALAVLAAFKGRIFCNTLCPAGALLGLLSRRSLYAFSIDHEKCVSCGKCEKICRASCIDIGKKSLDSERCVMCLDCVTVCPVSAVKYKKIEKPESCNLDRRRFMISGSAALAGGFLLAKGLRASSKPLSKAVMPPGAGNLDSFQARCTACGLCISSCPAKVIRPSLTEYGAAGLMQPYLDYSQGMCEFECTTCNNVCPNGALKPLSLPQKKLTRIGMVKYDQSICVVCTDETMCGACAEHCPTQAVHMEKWRDGLRIPVISPELCIGCGNCEYICPVRPRKAITVETLQVHQMAQKPRPRERELKKVRGGFPF